jgi:3-hydroxybutyryl-CoA dehydrogenase
MGTGIGIVSSRVANYEVVFVDPNAAGLKKSETFVEKWCKKEVEKSKLTEQEMKDVLGRMQWTSDIKTLSNVDLVIEAVNEDFDLKKRIF